MSWIEEIKNYRKQVHSQNGQEGYLEFILKKIGVKKGFLVDIGAGNGEHISNTKYFLDKGWKGILIDKEENEGVKQLFITKDNIVPFLKENDVPYEFDLLSLDIDGIDGYVLEEVMKEFKPKLIISEVNASFGDCRIIEYNKNHKWEGDSHYGYSLKYGEKLAKENGYTIIFQSDNQDLYYLRNDFVPEGKININFNHFVPFAHSESAKTWIYYDR